MIFLQRSIRARGVELWSENNHIRNRYCAAISLLPNPSPVLEWVVRPDVPQTWSLPVQLGRSLSGSGHSFCAYFAHGPRVGCFHPVAL